MLGYILWHHPASGIDAASYEKSLSAFHRTLTAHAPAGFLDSAAFGVREVPWFPAPSAYLDWYNVADFTSLGELNDAAVAGARKEPHDNVARMAGVGVGGLYRLVAGRADLPRTTAGTWLTKPDGMKYAGFLDSAIKLVDPSTMGLWQRQMTLGPGPEFCLLSLAPIQAPEAFGPVAIDLRRFL